MAQLGFRRIGLTGGIGSGKSTLGHMLTELGLSLVDADAMARELTGPQGAAMPDIAKVFGTAFVAANGSLHRERMRERVFKDPEAREKLQALLHPLISQAMFEAEAALQAQGKPLVVFDIPLLVESRHWRARLDRVLVVDCSPFTQIRRVMQRSGMGQADVERIMQTQAKREDRLAAADWVVNNETDQMEDLRAHAQALYLHLSPSKP